MPIVQFDNGADGASGVSKSNGLPVALTGSNAKGKETLNVGGTAVGFASIPVGATKAVITTETQDVRYWVDGSSPTAANGHLVKAGGSIELDNADQLAKFLAISVSGSAVLQISYF